MRLPAAALLLATCATLAAACSGGGGSAPAPAPASPVIQAFDATQSWGPDGDVRVRIRVTDPQADLRVIQMRTFDAGGAEIGSAFDVAPIPGQPALAGQPEVVVEFTFTGLVPLGVRQVELRAEDVAGHVATRQAPVQLVDYHGPGGACGTPSAACAGELACTAGTCGAAAGITQACQAASAPAFTAGQALVPVALSGPDAFEGSCIFWPGRDGVVRIDVTDPRGERLIVNNPGGGAHLRSACSDPTSQVACAAFGDLVQDLAPGSYWLVVEAVNASVEALLTRSPLLATGEACDPAAFPACPAGEVCADPGGAGSRCLPAAEAFAAACAAAPALVEGVSATGTFEHQWPPSAPSLFQNTCAAGAAVQPPETVFTFTLASRSAVEITTHLPGTNVDTLLTLLAGCTPPAELACSDDLSTLPPDFTSGISATLEAGTYTVVLEQANVLGVDGGPPPVGPWTWELRYTASPL